LTKKIKNNKKNLNKIYVALMGGIGDQLNQYIFGKYISKKFNLRLVLDKSYYNKKPAFPFRLDKFYINNVEFKENIFKIDFKFISYLRFICKLKIFIKIISKFNINNFIYEFWKKPNYINLKKPENKTYFFGYWHNKKYYISDIIKSLKIKNTSKKLKKFINKIKKNDVAIHIRGGDFLNNIHAVILNERYYKNAINYCYKKLIKPKFYVFTNDIGHSRKILNNLNTHKFIFIKMYKFKDFEEFEILRNFQNFIISNSTFGWTASLLSIKKSIICAPYNWYKNLKIDKKRIINKTIVFK